jgi:hypothetical protein
MQTSKMASTGSTEGAHIHGDSVSGIIPFKILAFLGEKLQVIKR